MNVVILRGKLTRTPEERVFDSGTRLVRYDVSIRSEEHGTENAPVVWFDPPSRATQCKSGDEVVVVGRVRRRWFRSGGASESRIEVVATDVVPTRQAKRANAAIERVLAAAEASAPPA
ncbi:MAG: single-stranded DNA-binding protein [Acidimicrobiales bacterium]